MILIHSDAKIEQHLQRTYLSLTSIAQNAVSAPASLLAGLILKVIPRRRKMYVITLLDQTRFHNVNNKEQILRFLAQVQ